MFAWMVGNDTAWSDVMHVGPWGYCMVTHTGNVSGSTCLAARSRLAGVNSPLGGPNFNGPGELLEGEASPTVAYVVGTLTDRRTIRASAVDAGGPRFWAWVVPHGQRLRRVVFYTASGHQVVTQSGAEYNRGL